MGRFLRKKSSSGIYHVTVRANDQNLIFLNDQDYETYLRIIKHYKKTCDFELYAYCLMNNHVHLLIWENKEVSGISEIMQKINLSFVKYYNKKYKRKGHLFQGRFNSKVVEDEDYFRTVLRYIHQNPVRAHATKKIINYQWSSIKEYCDKSNLCNTSFALELFKDDTLSPLATLLNHHSYFPETTETRKKLHESTYKLQDPDAINLIKSLAGVNDPKTVSEFNINKRNQIILVLKLHFMSDRQISRLTGVNRRIISAIKVEKG